MKRCVVTVVCLVCVISCSNPAPELQTLDEVMTFVRESAREIETWSADFEITMSMAGALTEMKGTAYGKGGRTVHETTVEAKGQIMKTRTVLDADGIEWTETEMMDQTQVTKLDMNAMAEKDEELTGISMSGLGKSPLASQEPEKILDFYAEIFDLQFEGIETHEGEKVFVITGSMKKGLLDQDDAPDPIRRLRAMIGNLELSLGAKDGFPRSTKLLGDDGALFMALRYKNVVLNEPIDDNLFEYVPPDGVAVMDMTESYEKNADEIMGKTNEGGREDK